MIRMYFTMPASGGPGGGGGSSSGTLSTVTLIECSLTAPPFVIPRALRTWAPSVSLWLSRFQQL